MEKYVLLIFSLFIITLYSCTKNQVTAQAVVDDEKIQAYLKANNLTMIKDPSGVYYQVVTPGTGPYPTIKSTVKVSYSGTFLDGQQFQATGSSTDTITGFGATGFQYGIEHINTGGRVRFILPSALGYGPAGNGSAIPPNSVLVFLVDLQGFY